jgi:hypothetical protein
MPLSTGRRIASIALVVPCFAAVLIAAQAPVQRPRDPGAAQTQPPAGKGLIAGTLVALDSGRPVRQGRVTVSGGDTRVTRFTITDESGRFSFDDLPAGAFNLSASKPGFLDVTYGQKRPGSGRPGTAITLAAGQRLERVSLPITRGGVITGIVYDEVGDVVYGTSVQAMRYVMRNGVRSLQVMRTATTDDRGIYRLPVLPPGEYAVVATPSQQADLMKRQVEIQMAEAAKIEAVRAAAEQMTVELRNLRARLGDVEPAPPTAGYAPTFHPASLLASGSTPVTIDGPEERAGVDIRLPLVPLGTISGVVTGEGPLPPGVLVTLSDTAETAVSFGMRTTRVGPNGQFSFTGLPPGSYALLARASAPVVHSISLESEARAMNLTVAGNQYIVAKDAQATGDALWAAASVAVGGGSVPVTMNLQRGMTLSGSVVFNGPSTAAIDLSRVRLTVSPVEEPGFRTEGMFVRDVPVTADGQFTIRGVLPGRYRVVPSSGVPAGFLIESAMFGGRDVLDFPLEVKPGEDTSGGVVTFATQQTELAGTMTDPAGKPAPGYTLILFAADGRFWTPQSRRIQTARPASDGRYAFRSLPAGDYRLIAVEDVEPGQWFDPAFLKELLGAALSVSLAPGEKRTQDIRASR